MHQQRNEGGKGAMKKRQERRETTGEEAGEKENGSTGVARVSAAGDLWPPLPHLRPPRISRTHAMCAKRHHHHHHHHHYHHRHR